MFQFTRFPSHKLFIHLWMCRFYPTRVSPFGLLRFNWCLVHSTQIFADLHVLLRLLMPRHPPIALCSFTYLWIKLSLGFPFSRANSSLRLPPVAHFALTYSNSLGLCPRLRSTKILPLDSLSLTLMIFLFLRISIEIWPNSLLNLIS